MVATELRLDPPVAPASDPDDGASRLEPQWIRALAFAGASGVAAFGSVGLALAIVGAYRPLLVVPLGAAAWFGVLRLAGPMLHARGSTRAADNAVAGIGLTFVGSIALWNAMHASEHVLINRDGGAYVNAARWIAGHGNLQVVPNVGPFAHQHALTFGSLAVSEGNDHSLSFQFAHLLPAMLAEARLLGGDRLMFAAPALLSGIALLAFFVAAWRCLRRPLVALAALVSFAFVIPEVSFSRDAYSEIPCQILLFSALWILADRRGLRTPKTAFVAGLLLGCVQAARIDAIALLVGLPVLFATAWILAAPRDRRAVAASAGACAVGLVPGLTLGFVDMIVRSSQYFHALRGRVDALLAAAAISAVASLVIVLVAAHRPGPRGDATRRGWIASAVVLGLGFSAWFVRPRFAHVRGAPNQVIAAFQAAANIPVDPTRSYWERSVVWMSWYLGPVTVAAAIVAAALLARSLVRRTWRDAFVGVAILGPPSVLYLWRASAFADQVWVDRRYLDSALPLLTLLAFALVAALAAGAPRGLPRWVPMTAAVSIATVAVLYPMGSVVGVRNMTEQRGDLGVVDDACRIIGPHAAVVVLQESVESVYVTVPQALRGWCNAPVAVMASTVPDRDELSRLAAAWSRRGTTLWIVAGDTATLRSVFPDARISSTRVATNPYFLETTLVRRPSHYFSERFELALAPVPEA